jgi:hypothetical protein
MPGAPHDERHAVSSISAIGENALHERELSSPKRIKLHLARFAHQDCSLMGDLSGGLNEEGSNHPNRIGARYLGVGSYCHSLRAEPRLKGGRAE